MSYYHCVSDYYDNDSTTVYDGIEDFQAMCAAVFGEHVKLHQVGDEWHDGRGPVLVPVNEEV